MRTVREDYKEKEWQLPHGFVPRGVVQMNYAGRHFGGGHWLILPIFTCPFAFMGIEMMIGYVVLVVLVVALMRTYGPSKASITYTWRDENGPICEYQTESILTFKGALRPTFLRDGVPAVVLKNSPKFPLSFEWDTPLDEEMFLVYVDKAIPIQDLAQLMTVELARSDSKQRFSDPILRDLFGYDLRKSINHLAIEPTAGKVVSVRCFIQDEFLTLQFEGEPRLTVEGPIGSTGTFEHMIQDDQTVLVKVSIGGESSEGRQIQASLSVEQPFLLADNRKIWIEGIGDLTWNTEAARTRLWHGETLLVEVTPVWRDSDLDSGVCAQISVSSNLPRRVSLGLAIVAAYSPWQSYGATLPPTWTS